MTLPHHTRSIFMRQWLAVPVLALSLTGCLSTAQRESRIAANAIAARTALIHSAPEKYRAMYHQEIIDGVVVVGMTGEEAGSAWSGFRKVGMTRLTATSGIQEQFVYRSLENGGDHTRSLYLENGQVVSVQP